jgi:heme-degrading monooxygenase HmoA
MRKILCLLVMLATIGTAAYGQVDEGTSQPTALNFDQDQLLNRLAALKPFKPEKGESESGYAFVVTQEEFKKSLVFLSKEKVDEVIEGFVSATAFSFKSDTQFLMLTRWEDQESASNFMKIRNEQWHLTDEAYPSLIKNVLYKEVDIAEDEKALLTRKTLEQGEEKPKITTSFISSRKHYLFECNLIGDYTETEVQKLILQIWRIIESEEQKGVR